ncbi:MAG TPA: hypothetical protein VM493_05225 [Vicinamibacterales bacterium]|nr:hypothetical protein [Vicinamibacterales bacterium]
MRTRKTVAFGMAVVFATSMMQSSGVGAQSLGTISGTADKEAKKPYTNYSVRARSVQAGSIASTVQLDATGKFELAGVDPANYLVELVNPKGKVVCTEGPFDLSKQPLKAGVKIECGNPEALLLLAAAAAAGITAGVVSNGSNNAPQPPTVGVVTVTSASASK